jgi:hypothetical protein
MGKWGWGTSPPPSPSPFQYNCGENGEMGMGRGPPIPIPIPIFNLGMIFIPIPPHFPIFPQKKKKSPNGDGDGGKLGPRGKMCRRMPLASPWFHHFGESAVTIGGLAAESKPPIRPDAFNISGLILRLDRRLRNRRMKPPLLPCFSRDQFCGYDRRPGRRMKPPIVRFQGQTCLFTCPVLDVYKYHTFSIL